MSSRRSFFKSLARAVAIVALAPQIAFRAPQLSFAAAPKIDLQSPTIDAMTDRLTADRIRGMMGKYYREKHGEVLS